jgi:hypothetical protein
VKKRFPLSHAWANFFWPGYESNAIDINSGPWPIPEAFILQLPKLSQGRAGCKWRTLSHDRES